MTEQPSRVCPYCAEQIKPAAKICPHCRQWLKLLSLQNPVTFMVGFYFCIVVLTLGFLIWFGRLVDSGMDFTPYRDGISVVESRMNFQESGKDASVYVVGVMTNQTAFAWKRVQLDVRFYDRAGKLIDGRMYLDGSTILSHSESAFRISTHPSHPLSDYDSYKIFVRYGQDARAHF